MTDSFYDCGVGKEQVGAYGRVAAIKKTADLVRTYVNPLPGFDGVQKPRLRSIGPSKDSPATNLRTFSFTVMAYIPTEFERGFAVC
jgi:hypothetical protein